MKTHIRLEAPDEVATISRIVGDAFGNDKTPDLHQALRDSNAWLGLSFVAEVGGELVGHISFTRGWLDAPDEIVEVLILSPVSVLPSHQRQGIGTHLILTALEMLATRAEPLVFLEGDPRFYSRLGFIPGKEAGFIRPSVRIPEPAFQFVKLPKYESWMTGQLVYPDAFWEMDCVGLRGERLRRWN